MGELRVLIPTTAFDASVDFYGTRIGLPVAMQWGADTDQGRGVIFAATLEARIELIEGGPAPTGLTISIETDDVEAIAARLADQLTRPPTDQPWGHRSCATVDPNGVAIVFFQVIGHDPAATGHDPAS